MRQHFSVDVLGEQEEVIVEDQVGCRIEFKLQSFGFVFERRKVKHEPNVEQHCEVEQEDSEDGPVY